MLDCDLLVEFEDEQTTVELPKYKNEYNKHTIEFYKTLREKKYNVISHDSFDCNLNNIFQYDDMWDPYTGEKINEKDPFGGLCFHPDDLIHFYHKRRLKLLWNEPKDIVGGPNAGYYEGYYGDGLGSGENIYIPGRGDHIELYLFRLPVDDCYLPPDSDLSIITMGPKLTNDEIKQIDELAEKHHPYNYQYGYGKKRPSLAQMKKMYDTAISKTPDLSKFSVDENELDNEELMNYRARANREAVEELKKM